MAESSEKFAAAGADADAAAVHQPYVPDHAAPPEFTWPAVLVGAVLGIIFGASSLYLVLKVGMTVSASIPVAVLSITLFRLFSRAFGVRRATILENNIVQTAGSAGESIAFGVGVTMPALMILGFEMDIGRVMVVSVLGGALGILMMIPLRRAFIVRQHGVLRYPEGTACADVLIVGEQGGGSAQMVFTGFGIAFVYQFLRQGLHLWRDTVGRPLDWFQKATPAIDTDPVLLGVGYIIGTRISCIMMAGGALASFVLMPAIRLFGVGNPEALYPGKIPIAKMSDQQLWDNYVLYIAAGAVAAGGIISLFQALPLIAGSIRAAFGDLWLSKQPAGGPRTGGGVRRTDRDMSMRVVLGGSVLLLLAIWATLPLGETWGWVNFLGAVLIVLFGFLFVTVSSRLTGEIGSSSNPISGMTVATLLLTCLIFLVLGWTSQSHRLVALSVAAIVCIAASNGGTTSQDLKTGYLVGATPRFQQLAILVGSVSSALVIGWILIAMNHAGTVYTKKSLPPLAAPIGVAELTATEEAPGDETPYRVWQALEGNKQRVPQGKYLVDDAGKIRYRVDPGINGSLARRDDGAEVQKFKAPKAQLMALITNGILQQKLPWTLVLLGVSMAVVLELCGVPSLPFAVGVYVSFSASAPIFLGGLARYVADRWARGGNGRKRTEAESEMSPGVLLSTGYIAGGAIAGVLVAFCMFSDRIPQWLSTWQYRHYVAAEEKPLAEQYADAARWDLGLGAAASESKPDRERQEEQASIAERIDEIDELNAAQILGRVTVVKGTVLAIPEKKTLTVAADATLEKIAEDELHDAEQAKELLDLNRGRLRLPAGASLALPQRYAPALWSFALLVGLLLVVGLGWWMGDSSANPVKKE